ncbi:hypothetical protein [Demequina sp. NBRC 110056]|uniref:hypothetical protein n=1 Tax=Demequina sp. NBRC 110056 TaxID=1570345 RepID=UPI000A04BDAB|nr:hypothetical protein [Demequina sp. NBRC 110056]
MATSRHRTALRYFWRAPAPRWATLVSIPLIVVAVVSFVVIILNLEDPPAWAVAIQPYVAISIFAVLIAGWTHTYVRIYRTTAPPPAA